MADVTAMGDGFHGGPFPSDDLMPAGADLQFLDSTYLRFGTLDGGDANMAWDGTNLTLKPAVDDTGAFVIGDGTTDMDLKVFLGAAADYVSLDVGAKALIIAGAARLDLSSATIAAGNTDGGVVKAGTSGTPVTEDTANMKFMSFYFDDGATSGEAVGEYLRLYVTGAGAEGIALRSFCSVTDVAAVNARGAHISLSFGTSGTVSGLGTALETTLHIPNSATQAGTLSSIKAAIHSDGATSDPAGARLSVFNVVNQGNATGMADVDTDCALFDLQGFAVTTGLMIYDSTGTAPANTNGSIRIRLPSGAAAYLMYYDQQAA